MSRGTVEVDLKGGYNLAPKDKNGLSDPYCVLCFLEPHVKKPKKKKSKVVKKNLNPAWNEKIELEVPDAATDLRVRCYDKDRVGKDFMGEVLIPVELVVTSDGAVKPHELKPKMPSDKVTGELYFGVKFTPSPGEKASEKKMRKTLSQRFRKLSSASADDKQSDDDDTQSQRESGSSRTSKLFRKRRKSSQASEGDPDSVLLSDVSVSEKPRPKRKLKSLRSLRKGKGKDGGKEREDEEKDVITDATDLTNGDISEEDESVLSESISAAPSNPPSVQKSNTTPLSSIPPAITVSTASMKTAPNLGGSNSLRPAMKESPRNVHQERNMIRLGLKTTEQEFQVMVHECKNLDAMDTIGTSDPYVVIYYGDEKHKTRKIMKNLNPKFGELLKFKRNDTIKELKVKVFDWDKIGADDLIGTVMIQLDNAEMARGDVEDWYQLGVKKGLSSMVMRKKSVHIKQSSGDQESETTDIRPGAFVQKEARQATAKIGAITLSVIYHPPLKSAASGTVEGYLTVNVLSCSDLIAKDANGFSDPYVKLIWGDFQKETTRIIKKCLNPVYNQEFHILMRGDVSKLKVEVWDWDRVSSDDLIGFTSVTVGELLPSPEVNLMTLTLKEEKKKAKVTAKKSKSQMQSTPTTMTTMMTSNVQKCAKQHEDILEQKREVLLRLCEEKSFNIKLKKIREEEAEEKRYEYTIPASDKTIHNNEERLAVPFFVFLVMIGLVNVSCRFLWSGLF